MESSKLKIVETIVVEGRDDLINIRQYVDADIVVTSGYHIAKRTLDAINQASLRCGVIIFTDPDRAGDLIRQRVEKVCSGKVKHAYVTRAEASKSDDIGVENASGEAILSALSRAKVKTKVLEPVFTKSDLFELGLSGSENSAKNRLLLCDKLRIKRSNSKSLLNALNAYGISKTEVISILEETVDK